MHVPVDISLTEYTKLQEQECRALLQLLGEMGIATADRVYGPGDAIYNEGEYGDALYVLTSGVLKLFRPYSGSKEATLRLLKPWDIFGHLAFAGETRQRAYAEAVTECRVTKVPKIFVERAVRQEPRAAFQLMTLLDLRLTHQDLAAMVASTRESVTKVLNEMRNRGVIEVDAGRITLKDTRTLTRLKIGR